MALNERDYRRGTRNRIKGPGTGTSDDIPAMLSNGEFVVKAVSAAKIGDKALNHMNRTGRLPMKATDKMRYGQMRGKRRVKLGVGGTLRKLGAAAVEHRGLIGRLGAGALALYGAKKGIDYWRKPELEPTTTPEITPGTSTPAVAPNPNYGGVETPANQDATDRLKERLGAEGAKGGYVSRMPKKKLNMRKMYGGGRMKYRKMKVGGTVMKVKPGRGVISTTGRGPTDARLDGYTTHGYRRGGKTKGFPQMRYNYGGKAMGLRR